MNRALELLPRSQRLRRPAKHVHRGRIGIVPARLECSCYGKAPRTPQHLHANHPRRNIRRIRSELSRSFSTIVANPQLLLPSRQDRRNKPKHRTWWMFRFELQTAIVSPIVEDRRSTKMTQTIPVEQVRGRPADELLQ